jgi:serine/threonine-protein kinase
MAAPDPLIGQILDGKYLIQERIGGGGMGSVYRALHVSLDAPRAVKVMRQDLAESGDFVERFQNEARLAEGLRHPNLVALHDFARLPDGSWFIVSELVEGESIAASLRRGRMFTSREVATLLGQLCDGLAMAHRRGIVHRDISPDNVMIANGPDGDPHAKLLDFGLAKDVAGDRTLHTASGLFLGKVGYSSPEQMGLLPRGEAIDARTDVFSMAAVAFEMLRGELPWRKDSVQSYVHDLLVRPEAQLQEAIARDAPAFWRAALSRALARHREERTPSVQALKADMNEAARRTAESELGLPRTQSFVEPLGPGQATWRKGLPPAGATRATARVVRVLVLVAAAGVLALGAWLARRPPGAVPTAAAPAQVGASTGLPRSSGAASASTPLDPAGAGATTAPSVQRTPPPPTPAAPATGLERHGTQAPRVAAGAGADVTAVTAARTPAPTPLAATLTLRSDPSALVTLDGEQRGRTPLTLDGVTPGSHSIVLLAEDGRRLEERLDLAPGETLERTLRLPGFGSLSVTADVWVEVSVAGEAPRQTPCRIERLPAGRHVVKASRAGYRERSYAIEIVEGETYRLNVSLERK